jgi:uncharacterized protein YebE (UPF0316 family)
VVNSLIELNAISSEFLYSWIILPLLIFLARVCDVSLGTIRIIFISKGIKYLAPLIGFFEILIWLLAIGQIMQNLTNIYYYLFYAGGFATGNLMGIILEEKLSIGTVAIRIITRKNADTLIEVLRKKHISITVVDAQGAKGPVKLLFSIVKRQNAKKVIRLVKKYNPNAFYSIEDIRQVSKDLPPYRKNSSPRIFTDFIKNWRKGK